jgi:glutamate 5-kinase
MAYDGFLVVKIGSMALIDRDNNDIDYNKFARIGRELLPGMILVSSGAAEIGRLDYIKRRGIELKGKNDEIKTDYAAQGQAILMSTYRSSVNSAYGVRQLLVEHQHFNDKNKREHIKGLLTRCAEQNAIPIINYNDAVSFEETRKLEIQSLRAHGEKTVELIDNDETAAQIACLMKAKTLLILTTVNGIYTDPARPETLAGEISGATPQEVVDNIEEYKKLCVGASRIGAGGARAKLEFAKEPVLAGAAVIIANAKYKIQDILSGAVPHTRLGVR